MRDNSSKFRDLLYEQNKFTVTWEIVPGRGSYELAQEEAIAAADRAARGGKVDVIAITDNPGGNPALSAEMLGAEMKRAGAEPMVHFTCKDKSRNQLEALMYGLERASVYNLLVLTGDYTLTGYLGRSSPVFDMDAVQLLGLVGLMNGGLEVGTPRGGVMKLAPTHFFAGAAASSFKATEAEQVCQYYKLQKKLQAGAQFIIGQVGYDARKHHELLLMMRRLGYGHVPLIGNIYVLSAPAARAMNQNRVAGCVVTDDLLSLITEESKAKDRGKAKRLERAAKMYAYMKGMGYRGVHVGGHGLKYEEVEAIVDMGEALTPQWQSFIPEFDYPQTNGWYYFQHDAESGLNIETPVARSGRPATPFSYRLFRLLHQSMFDTKGLLFRPMRSLAAALDGSRLEDPFTRFEHIAKVITNDCMHCGDCGLPDVAYICPTSQCPKQQRNGPCGGSYEGWCEVYPNKRRCIWVKAYQRLKHFGEESSLADHLVPPVNHDLRRTASWLNFFTGRDHTAKRLGIEPPKKKEKAGVAGEPAQ